MTLFELICLAVLALAIFNGLYWLSNKYGGFNYLNDDEIEQRIKEANDALNNRPRVRAMTKGESCTTDM